MEQRQLIPIKLVAAHTRPIWIINFLQLRNSLIWELAIGFEPQPLPLEIAINLPFRDIEIKNEMN